MKFINYVMKSGKKSIAQNICLNYGKPIVDGLIVIEKININNYKVDYYNNDGTWETLCINSLRCVGLLLYNKYNLKSLIAHCGDGKHIINVKNSNNIKVSMNKPIYKSDKIDIDGYLGYYLFADYCTGRIWAFQFVNSQVQNLKELTEDINLGNGEDTIYISSFGEDANGELYIIDYGGDIYRLDNE